MTRIQKREITNDTNRAQEVMVAVIDTSLLADMCQEKAISVIRVICHICVIRDTLGVFAAQGLRFQSYLTELLSNHSRWAKSRMARIQKRRITNDTNREQGLMMAVIDTSLSADTRQEESISVIRAIRLICVIRDKHLPRREIADA